MKPVLSPKLFPWYMKTLNGRNANRFFSFVISPNSCASKERSGKASSSRLVALFILSISSLLLPCTLFPRGRQSEPEPEPVRPIVTRAVTYLQERYDAMVAPGIIMLPISGTSAVSSDTLVQVERELHRQLVTDGRMRPVRIDRWLLTTYGTNRAANPFVIMGAILSEQFVLPVRYMGKPFIFKEGDYHYFALHVFLLETRYPITFFRRFTPPYSVEKMIALSIAELNVRSQPVPLGTRRRVVMDDFALEFFQLVDLPDGGFIFAPTPFIEKNGIILRDGDDFFSRILGYILETTNLFRVMQIGDFRAYSNTIIPATSPFVDYRIRGRVQLSAHESILHVDIINVRTGANILSLRYPLLDFTFDGIWNAYRSLSVQIVERLFNSEDYGVVPALESPGRGFFANNMFVGWNTLENFILPRGLHVISTGSHYQIEYDSDFVNSYHVILENRTAVYADAIGRRILNLLQQ